MHCVDVNVLVNAFIAEQPHSSLAFNTLVRLQQSPRKTIVLPTVATGFLRLVTNRRVFRNPSPIDHAADFLDAFTAGRHVSVVEPGPEYWRVFRDLVNKYGPIADEIPDVQIAASAIVLGASVVSFDRGFARFSEIEWINPLAEGI
jgi:toxin-antitoxin system PIN domain toxin